MVKWQQYTHENLDKGFHYAVKEGKDQSEQLKRQIIVLKAKRKPKIELPYEIQQAQMNLFDEQNDMFGAPWSDNLNSSQPSFFGKSI